MSRVVAFAGGRNLGSEWYSLVRGVVSFFAGKGFGIVVGDAVGADFLVARACSELGARCLVVCPPFPDPSLSFVAGGRVPPGVVLACALVPPRLPLRRRLAARTRVVASFSRFGVAFGGGRGTLGVFARSILRKGGRVLWFPCGSSLSSLRSFSLAPETSVKLAGFSGYFLTLRE